MRSPVDILSEHGFLAGLEPPRQQNFIDACKSGLVDVVRAYLAVGMPHDVQREISFEPALIAAAEGGSIPIVELLLERGAPLEQRDRSGDTAFRTAINWGHLELARRLAALGADRDAPNEYRESALEHVIDEDKQDAVDLLLELGANPGFVSGWRSPMRTALESGKHASLVKLLDAGASASLVLDEHGVTALHEAITKSNTEAFDLLLDRGADRTARDAYGLMPLDYALEIEDGPFAAKLGEPSSQQRARARFWKQVADGELGSALETLAREDLPVDVRNREHETPLLAFATAGNLDGVKRLLERGANPAPPKAVTAVSAALAANQDAVLEHLLAAKLPIFDAEQKLSGMSTAAWDGHIGVARRVLAACSVEERARFAEHVDSLIMQGHVELLRAFIEYGVPTDEPGMLGDRPLARAVTSDFSQEIVDALLAAGASVRNTDKGGDTPLHELLAHYEWDADRIPVVRELLRRGAPLDAVNWQIRTPYDAAGDDAKIALQQIIADDVMTAGTAATDEASISTPGASWATLPIFYKAGHHDFVLKLVDAGVPIDAPKGADGVFDVALEAQDLHMVRALLARGANVNHETSYGYTPLQSSASSGNVELVRALLDAGANVDARSDFGWTVGHSASGDLAMMELLFERGAKFDQRVASPIFGAVGGGHEECVDWLIAHGAYLDSSIPHGSTPLSTAIEKGNEAIALKLIAAGASPSKRIRENGNTPLTAATKQGQIRVVKALIAAGADPNEADAEGNTALSLMTQRKQLREAFAELLLANGVDVTVPKVERLPAELTVVTPAWFAVYCRDHEAVERALDDKQLGPNDRDPWGITPLMAAVQLRAESIIHMLLERGADHTLEDPAKSRAWDYGGLFSRVDDIDEALKAAGETLSMDRLNAQAARSMVFDELKGLLDRGELAKVATMIRERRAHPLLSIAARSLVHEAIDRDDEDLLGVLIDLGISLDQHDSEGVSPIALALSRDRLDLVERLVAAGADRGARGTLQRAIAMHASDETLTAVLEWTKDLRSLDRHGEAPIHRAAAQGRAELVGAMLDRDATLRDLPSGDDRTPLIFAVWYESVEVTERLLAAGADPDTEWKGTTPLHLAIRGQSQRIAQLLMKHGGDLDCEVGDGTPRAALEEHALDEEWLDPDALAGSDPEDDTGSDDVN